MRWGKLLTLHYGEKNETVRRSHGDKTHLFRHLGQVGAADPDSRTEAGRRRAHTRQLGLTRLQSTVKD
jgi:hypothetical protein